MRFFAAITVCVLAVALSARAQQSADDEYLIIYSLMQQADTHQSSGDLQEALTGFNDVQNELQKFQRIYPDWNPKIINFRLDYVSEKIAELTQQTATNAPPVAAASVPTNAPPTASAVEVANWQAQLNALQGQLRQSQTDNSSLASKLKEALAAQPAAIDPRELAKAREQIRQLMKENDLLKAGASQGGNGVLVLADTNSLAEMQRALAVANQKLADAAARENKMALENQALRARVQAMLASPEALEALREENALLKRQVAELKLAVTNSAAITDLTAQLAAAHVQITMLQSNMEIVSLEKMALQQRVQQLQAANVAPPSPDQKENEERIRSLTNERDDLLAKLDAANKKLYGGKKEDAIARIDQLQGEVNRLRARLEIAEAHPVPFTPEEAAFFKTVPKLSANPDAEKKAISELPNGSAELVADAQKHFSAGEFDQAENDYLQILQRDQNNGLALANLASIELQQNKLDDAERHITAALAKSPDDAYNLLVLGEVKFGQHKFDDALDALGRAAKGDPQNPEIQNVIGASLAQKGLRAQAETAFRKAIQIDPKFADAHQNLAVIYINQQPPMVELARWHYQKALDAGMPRNPDLEKEIADKSAAVNP